MPTSQQALHRYGCQSTLRPTNKTRTTAQQRGRQENLSRVTRNTGQTQVHASRNKMGLVRITIRGRHDKSISSNTVSPAATHTLHQHQTRWAVCGSKTQKRSRETQECRTVRTTQTTESTSNPFSYSIPCHASRRTTHNRQWPTHLSWPHLHRRCHPCNDHHRTLALAMGTDYGPEYDIALAFDIYQRDGNPNHKGWSWAPATPGARPAATFHRRRPIPERVP